MILRATATVVLVAFFNHVSAGVAPEITTIIEGFSVVAKLPCINCPLLYKDTSKGSDGPWTERKDENALLLNISLPYDSTHLSINNAPLLTPSKILPRIYANQVLIDISKDELSTLIATDQLDNLGGGYFGISYSYSLRQIKEPKALLFYFEPMELWSDLITPPITIILDDPAQKVLEVILLQRPLLSAGDPGNTFEIISVHLIARPDSELRMGQKKMWFFDWDASGKKGILSHLFNSASESFTHYTSSGVWALFIFIIAVMALFVLACLFCIFTFGWHKDDYERAQHKKWTSGGRGSITWGRNDPEKATKFRSAENLGLRSSGTVVGVGKSE